YDLEKANCIEPGIDVIHRKSGDKSPWKLNNCNNLNLAIFPADPVDGTADDILFIMYTSGTTGPPKGVLVTDKMLRASAYAATSTSDAKAGDIFPVWEPLYHIGAAQLLPLALEVGAELHFIGAFSASTFWQKVREIRATQIHFLGGILQILLRQPVDPLDKHHHCRIAWGGGAPATITVEFETRFNIQVRENYGMTEASSLTSINSDGHKGSVGNVAPYFEVKIMSGDDKRVAAGIHGEIVVRQLEDGLITPGYFNNAEATRNTIRNGWLYTGDLGCLDENNYLYYAGRVKESIRRRGENISAWEIERVVERLAAVEQAAAIGVPDELGDEEIKLFVKLTDEANPEKSISQICNWCAEQLPAFQIPHHLAVIDQFPLTGTQRIRKELLPKSIDDCITVAQVPIGTP
ncbi:MAG: crotonobetaine/carnitine-CoA ligase, partial [Parasphingorhabdus sp.]